MACQKGHIPVVKLLLEAKVMTDIQGGKVIFGRIMTVATSVYPILWCTVASSHEAGNHHIMPKFM